MGVMPEVLAKGSILQKLDGRYKVPRNAPPAQIQQIIIEFTNRLNSLKQLQPYPFGSVIALGQGNSAISRDDADHIRAHWLNETVTTSAGVTLTNAGWWKSVAPAIEPILRQGLIAALEVALTDPNTQVARQRPLSIVFHWVCHPADSSAPAPGPIGNTSVQVSVSWSDEQVNLIIHTPDPKIPASLTGTEPIFVIKQDKTTGVIVKVRP